MAADKKEKTGFFSRIGQRIKDIRAEVKRIVWPSKEQVKNNTFVVIVVSLIAALIVFGLDTIFGVILRLILGLA
jgi:preprotein translocase subunit SecE